MDTAPSLKESQSVACRTCLAATGGSPFRGVGDPVREALLGDVLRCRSGAEAAVAHAAAGRQALNDGRWTTVTGGPTALRNWDSTRMLPNLEYLDVYEPPNCRRRKGDGPSDDMRPWSRRWGRGAEQEPPEPQPQDTKPNLRKSPWTQGARCRISTRDGRISREWAIRKEGISNAANWRPSPVRFPTPRQPFVTGSVS